MDGGWWERSFLLLGWNFTEEQREKVRMIGVVINLETQCELLSGLMQRQMITYRSVDVYRVCVYAYIHIYMYMQGVSS